MARFTQKIMSFPIKNADSYHLRSALAKKDGPPFPHERCAEPYCLLAAQALALHLASR